MPTKIRQDKSFKKVHFIGIGGIGVSSLARYWKSQGAVISGSDLAASEITEGLEKEGIIIAIGPHKKENVPPDVDMIIYSPAVRPDNPEIEIFKSKICPFRTSPAGRQNPKSKINPQIPNTKYQIPILSYPQALGELTKKYFTVAVSGAHGKSTTTAMIAGILVEAGLDPTVIIGTKLKEFGNANFRSGQKYSYAMHGTRCRILVIEADEWQASFLNYWPKIIALTNVEAEHLDYYNDLDHIIRTFREYVGHLPTDGTLVANADDENIRKIISNFQFPISKKNPKSKFEIRYYGKKNLNSEFLILRSLLKVPGEHNVYNALAALAVARVLKIPDAISFKALSRYQGAWRRFEKIGSFKGADVISDYAHHPTEIKATLKAAREKYPDKEIWCVFQPHQIQRTKYLFDDFVGAFGDADKILLLDIYGVAGREKTVAAKGVSSEKLASEIKKRGKDARYFGDFGAVAGVLSEKSGENKVIFVMGAGDVWKVGKLLTGQ